MTKINDLTGTSIGKIQIRSRADNDKKGNARWHCICFCGRPFQARGYEIGKRVKSCGCLMHAEKHGLSRHPLYGVLAGMKQRCCNPKDKSFHHYGGRGIVVSPNWDDPKEFIDWSMANGWRKGLDIDRIDNDGPYSPDNCRFVSRGVNSDNRRTSIRFEYRGQMLTVSELSKISGLAPKTLRTRLGRLGMTVEEAMTLPSDRAQTRLLLQARRRAGNL